MSPELAAALKDGEVSLALKRLYNYRKLRDLGAPPVVVEKASLLLDKSKGALGARFAEISAGLFVEFQDIENAAFQAEQDWDTRCQSCSSWNGGVNNRSQEMWCIRHSYETKPFPDVCPDYSPAKADGEK